jgi:hypothetical protein
MGFISSIFIAPNCIVIKYFSPDCPKLPFVKDTSFPVITLLFNGIKLLPLPDSK